jgi:hypothetical protein
VSCHCDDWNGHIFLVSVVTIITSPTLVSLTRVSAHSTSLCEYFYIMHNIYGWQILLIPGAEFLLINITTCGTCSTFLVYPSQMYVFFLPCIQSFTIHKTEKMILKHYAQYNCYPVGECFKNIKILGLITYISFN